MVAYLEKDSVGYDAGQNRDASDGLPITPEPVNMYRAEIEAFSESILTGKPSELSGEVGRRSQAILTACYESARQGKPLSVE
jgi:predicted dehydrogenase